MERSGPHRKAARLLRRHQPKWLPIEWLPAYAPELNPAEQVWNHSKHSDLANYLPDDTKPLRNAVRNSFSRQRSNQRLLRSCFRTTHLRL